MVAHEAKINDISINFFSYFKKSTSDDVANKIKSGSVIPKVEFKINLGSNAINATPTNAIFLLKILFT